MFSRLSGRLSSLPSTRRKRKISDDGDEKGNNHHDDDDDDDDVDDDDGCGGRRWQQWGVIKNAQMSSGASRLTDMHTEKISSDSLFKT